MAIELGTNEIPDAASDDLTHNTILPGKADPNGTNAGGPIDVLLSDLIYGSDTGSIVIDREQAASIEQTDGIAIGNSAVVNNDTTGLAQSIAIGPQSEAGQSGGNSARSTAVGALAKAYGNASTALGSKAIAGENVDGGNSHAIAVGNDAIALGDNSIAISVLNSTNNATAAESIAIGKDPLASGINSIAIGTEVSTESNNATVIGPNNQLPSDADDSVLIGSGYNTTDFTGVLNRAVILGSNTNLNSAITENDVIAIGSVKSVTGASSIAIGKDTSCENFSSVAIGENAICDSSNSVLMGLNSNCSSNSSVVLGTLADADSTGNKNVAIGNKAKAKGNGSVAIGSDAVSNNDRSVAIGPFDDVDFNKVETDAKNQIKLGTSNQEVKAPGGLKSGQVTITDDGVHSFTPRSNFGKIVVHDGAAEVGEFLYDITNGNIAEIADLNGNFETSTASLGGTTGTDAKITVSADSANTQIDIENRLGGSRDVVYTLSG